MHVFQWVGRGEGAARLAGYGFTPGLSNSPRARSPLLVVTGFQKRQSGDAGAKSAATALRKILPRDVASRGDAAAHASMSH
ncbi:hypothetical protein Bxe_B2404 [Paraburkholderia xenovorans LB400]|uniref:Uncharacterized protein n=1 Tax=Paraburkholderia xenovorans (strain LB400) TaxID=266265 RepID=Q13QQ2_PARXL|nr:hypothetical protein Bxe_B2404 [Paraburkholderia xenovorans LB400]